jgi:hypothetical protein
MPFCSRCTFATVSWVPMRLMVRENRGEGPNDEGINPSTRGTYGSKSCSLHISVFSKLFAYFFFNVHLHLSSKIKSKKEAKKQYNQGFTAFFA